MSAGDACALCTGPPSLEPRNHQRDRDGEHKGRKNAIDNEMHRPWRRPRAPRQDPENPRRAVDDEERHRKQHPRRRDSTDGTAARQPPQTSGE
jgi:hypothetical protein